MCVRKVVKCQKMANTSYALRSLEITKEVFSLLEYFYICFYERGSKKPKENKQRLHTIRRLLQFSFIVFMLTNTALKSHVIAEWNVMVR